MGRQYKLVVCDQLKITVSQRRKKTPNLFLTLKCRIRVRNLTCWKRSEMRVRPELTLETATNLQQESVHYYPFNGSDRKWETKRPDSNLFICFDMFCGLHGSTLSRVVRGHHRNYPSSPTISRHNLTSRGCLFISS